MIKIREGAVNNYGLLGHYFGGYGLFYTSVYGFYVFCRDSLQFENLVADRTAFHSDRDLWNFVYSG